MRKHQHDSSSHLLERSITNSEIVEEYLGWKETHSRTAFKAYRIWVERFQDFVRKSPEALKLSDVTAFARLIQRTYAPKNVQYGMSIIHNYLRFWKEQERLFVPLYLVRIPKAIANTHNAITEEEYQKMLKILQEPGLTHLRDRCIIRLLHDTGMRVGELCSLNVGDMENGTAVIRTEKTTRRRRVFWTEETEFAIREHMQDREKICRSSDASSALFVGVRGKSGTRITSRSVQRMVKEVARLAGIDRVICPHSFRHGFIHRSARKGIPDSVIALLVGHATPFTVAHYTKLSGLEVEEAYRKVFEQDRIGESRYFGSRAAVTLT